MLFVEVVSFVVLSIDEDDWGVVDLGQEDLREADSGQSCHEFEVVLRAVGYLGVSLDDFILSAKEDLLVVVFEQLSIEGFVFDHY